MNRKMLFILLFISNSLVAQTINYQQIIPEHFDTVEFAEKLVYLAWQNNPENQVFRSKLKQAESAVFQAQFSWLRNINMMVQYNSNQFSGENFNLVPRMGLGFMINIGSIVFVPSNTKIAKEEVKVNQAQLNGQKLLIRREVLKVYNTYLMNVNMLKIKTQASEDAHAAYILQTQKFKNGEVSMEDFNNALNLYTTSIVNKTQAENDILISKLELESLIGVRLEDVQ